MAEKTEKKTADFLETDPEHREMARALQRLAEIEEREFEQAQEDHADLEAPPGFVQRVMDRIDQETFREIEDRDPTLVRALRRLVETEDVEFEQAQKEYHDLKAPKGFATKVLTRAGLPTSPDNPSWAEHFRALFRRLISWPPREFPATSSASWSSVALSLAPTLVLLLVVVPLMGRYITQLESRVIQLEKETLLAAAELRPVVTTELRPLAEAPQDELLVCGKERVFFAGFSGSKKTFDIRPIDVAVNKEGLLESLSAKSSEEDCPEDARQLDLVVYLRSEKMKEHWETDRPFQVYLSRGDNKKAVASNVKPPVTSPELAKAALLSKTSASRSLRN